MEKVRKAFYVEEELLGQVDALLPQADVRSRNEFVNRALRFYIGYLTSEKIENWQCRRSRQSTTRCIEMPAGSANSQ